MAIQISKTDLPLYKKEVPCKCEHCENTFYISKSEAYRIFKGTINRKYCSNACYLKHKNVTKNKICSCFLCSKQFSRPISAISERNFCSHSCSAKFNNQNNKEKKCVYCNTQLHKKGKYCSAKCQKDFNFNKKINLWLKGEINGADDNFKQLKSFVRKYMLDNSQHKCSKCGWNTIHPITNKVPLQINHIDGDASNNSLDNLEVLCPNCHSLTPNFGSLNKKSTRTYRYKRK